MKYELHFSHFFAYKAFQAILRLRALNDWPIFNRQKKDACLMRAAKASARHAFSILLPFSAVWACSEQVQLVRLGLH